VKKTNKIKSFEQFNKTLKNSTNERYFGGSDSDGEVNIKIDGDDEGTKKIIVKEIQILLNNFGGRINLYLDGERIHSREKFKDINFSPVTGDFDITGSKLSSIQGSPRSATNERYFGGSINDGVVNIKIDGDDEELKKSIVKQIQNILNNYSGMVNLYLDGEQINSRSWG
jgi:predicted component of type VI protein secretion system